MDILLQQGIVWLRHKWDLVLVVGLAVLIFALQVWYLRLAAAPYTDESIYAQAGRMMFLQEYVPYRDFALPHPPLLALFSGIGFWIFHSMFPARVVYLLLNCASLLPLYLLLKHLGKQRIAALAAVLFYATYSDMVHHDWRFLALRQLSNVFLIMFLYFGVVQPTKKSSFWWQLVFALGSVFTFLQTAFNLAVVSLAMIFSRPKGERRSAFFRYAKIGTVALLALLLLFLLIPQSLDMLILTHLGERLGNGIGRIDRMLNAARVLDGYFYVLGTTSLLVGLFFLKKLRWYLLAMLMMIIGVSIPREFWTHYYVIAGPAFACGIMCFCILIRRLFKNRLLWVGYVLVGIAVAYQLWLNIPGLWSEWMHNVNSQYYELTARISTSPNPILTFTQPIYAVDADRDIAYYYYATEARVLPSLSLDEFSSLASQACLILLSGRDLGFVPQDIQDTWSRIYTPMPWNGEEKIFLTHNPQCQ
ncbi:MAG: hypothetical protein PHH13_05255 [Candidatus Peribacteraceae bacterium]|nr:hypothetical protein [Candidatus Peribacteraceae bacterium]